MGFFLNFVLDLHGHTKIAAEDILFSHSFASAVPSFTSNVFSSVLWNSLLFSFRDQTFSVARS